MKILHVFIIAFFVANFVKAQATDAINKVNTTAATLNQGASSITNGVNAASNTAAAVGKSVSLIKGIIPNKKEKNKEKEKTETLSPEKTPMVITMTISNIDYAKLKLIEENIQAITNVSSTSKKFSSAISTISVSYTGQADELWDAVPENIKTFFEMKELTELMISLESKK